MVANVKLLVEAFMGITFLQAFKLGFAVGLGATIAVSLASAVFWIAYYAIAILTYYAPPVSF